MRRVLHIIREEAAAAEASGEDGGGSERAELDVASRAAARVPSLATLLEVPTEAVPPPQGALPARRAPRAAQRVG